MLDFTYSPFIASFFALERAEKDKDAVVWVINKNWIRDRAKDTVPSEVFDAFAKMRDGESFEKMYLENQYCFAGSVNPTRLNERLTLQQGVFLCPGNIRRTFVENLKGPTDPETLKNYICKIVIGHQCRTEVLERLRKMNIDRATLFPGLDGFSESLNTRFKEIGELPVDVYEKWPKAKAPPWFLSPGSSSVPPVG